ncbi:MAG: thioredoxin domain-containing protein, partial [Pseudomonadota bacterium]|nr:thioredoxin domain-containing protein [Pseudomonadota bacterium]
MATSHVVATDSDSFASAVIERSNERPVLVDFWADWCGPCHSLSPLVEELAGDHEDSLRMTRSDAESFMGSGWRRPPQNPADDRRLRLPRGFGTHPHIAEAILDHAIFTADVAADFRVDLKLLQLGERR